jgi:ATP-dependent Zn protease
MLSTLAEKLRAIARSPRKLAQFSLVVVAMLVFARYSTRSKAAITELPYSKFIELLSLSPQKVKSLRVSPLSFRYILDGAGPAFTKIVSIESSLLERLIKSGVEFSAVSSPKSVVGALVALGYVWFLWRVTSRMLHGPQDGDAAGRGRDKLRLQAYGNLSFDDVAGQDAAKREVQEVCEMLQVTKFRYVPAYVSVTITQTTPLM